MTIKEILKQGNPKELIALFNFTPETSDDKILIKFNLWGRYFFHKYFESGDAPFHKEMTLNLIHAYKGNIETFINIAFRGAGKDVKTKLFIAFCILNDTTHFRKFYKVLSADLTNAKQLCTDVYNMLIQPRILKLYPDTFIKSEFKREETMGAFTTATGIKVMSDTVGTEQRGAIQEEARPDFIIFNDIESRKTLRSAVISRNIWDNMEEARTGLQKGGSTVFLANYISEMGNVHKLVTEKLSPSKSIMIVPIIEDGKPTWDRYTLDEIKVIKQNADDYEGEYLCQPSASKDQYFDRASLDRMTPIEPIETLAGFKIFKKYNPSHRYAGGMDIAGGVGLDSSASVFIDFSTVPAQVVGTYNSNEILPEAFGDEIVREANIFGGCLIAPENNKFDQTILKAQQLRAKLYTSAGKIIKIHQVAPQTFGWNTNSLTKSTMLSGLREAIESGLLELNDKDLINEAKYYSRNDMIDRDVDIRLATRHNDLLMSCFVEGTKILTNMGQVNIEKIKVGDLVLTRDGFKPVKHTMVSYKPITTNIGLTGTLDHPIFYGNNKIKDLSCITNDDILYIWNQKQKKIEKLSYTEVLNTIDTHKLNNSHTKAITWVVVNGKFLLNTYIGKYGKIISEQFQKVLLFITKMATKTITTLQICKCCLIQNICIYTCKNQKEKKNSERILKRTEKKSMKVLLNTTKKNQKQNICVIFVKNLLEQLRIMQSSVLGHVYRGHMVRILKNLFKQRHVKYATNYLKPEYHTKKGVQQNVLNTEGELRKVYNLEIADKPEYFANNVLVHNCCIAWQMNQHARPSKPLMEYSFDDLKESNEAI